MYAFQINVNKDEKTGRNKIRVYNLTILSGKAPLQDREYNDFEAPTSLKLSATKFKLRLKQREERQSKEKDKSKDKK